MAMHYLGILNSSNLCVLISYLFHHRSLDVILPSLNGESSENPFAHAVIVNNKNGVMLMWYCIYFPSSNFESPYRENHFSFKKMSAEHENVGSSKKESKISLNNFYVDFVAGCIGGELQVSLRYQN